MNEIDLYRILDLGLDNNLHSNIDHIIDYPLGEKALFPMWRDLRNKLDDLDTVLDDVLQTQLE